MTGRAIAAPRHPPLRGDLRALALAGALLASIGAALLATTAPLARAQSTAAAPRSSPMPVTPASAAELRGWLARIHDAAVRSNYVGTLVNSAGGTVASSRVAHYGEGRTELQRIDAMDGEPRSMLRVGDEMRLLFPRLRLAVVEPVDPRASFPSLVSGSEQRIPELYDLHVETGERVAGRDADRLRLKARDGARYDRLLWTDRQTGLLLRVETLADGRTLESSAFSEVKLGVRPDPAAITGELHRADGWHLLKPAMQPTRLEDEGWTLQPGLVPAGFQPIGCMRRTLSVGTPAPGGGPVLQTIFSDGLTHVSLFIEPFQPERHTAAGLSTIGATHTLTRHVGAWWLTAIGDVPPATLDAFMRAVGRRPGEPAAATRP